MATMETDRLRDDYLRRLAAAASELPRERREELVDEIREHLDAALAETDPGDEVAVRNAIERLGPPDEIVRAAADREPTAAPRSRFLEIVAIVLLVVPGVGWLPGVVLVALSRVWSGREKLVGILLAVAPAIFWFVAFNVGTSGGASAEVTDIGSEPPPAEDTGSSFGAVELLFLFLLSGLPAALYLGWRLRARGRA